MSTEVSWQIAAVFSNNIQHKRVLNADQLFPSSHIWNDRSSFHDKSLKSEGLFFSTKFNS